MTASEVFKTICDTLDGIDWMYNAYEQEMRVVTGMKGEDIPINITFTINDSAKVLMVYSVMPFDVKPEKRVEMAMAVCVANDKLVNGVFDYSLEDGTIAYRMTESYDDCQFGADCIMYFVRCLTSTVDAFNDRFFALNEGQLSLEEFMKNPV